MAVSSETIKTVEDLTGGEYAAGFVTDIEAERAPKGLNEDIVRFISAKKDEPEWLLEWRLRSFRHWTERMLPWKEPRWAKLRFDEIDYQDSYYYAAPKRDEDRPKSLDEVDPEVLATYEKLGIPLREQEFLAGVAVDGPIALTECIEDAPGDCDRVGFCPTHGNWQVINQAVRQALARISLSEMASPFPGCETPEGGALRLPPAH